MKTNIFRRFPLLLCGMVLAFASCADMMDVDNDRLVYEEDNRIDNPNDSIYSVMGVLAKIQKVADRCLLMGELRGDLMVTDADNAASDLQDIENFNIAADNSYGVRRDFYDIINNCNYIIAHMDISILDGQTQVMLPEYAQVKALRAWTYWQMGLIFGSVNYLTEPLVSTDQLDVKGTKMNLDELAAALIEDLTPYSGVRMLDYGSVDGWNSSEFFVDPRMLIGDFYLFTNQYEKAAEMYYDMIDKRNITVSSSYNNYWAGPTRESLIANHNTAFRYDVLTRIPFTTDLRGTHSQLSNLTYSPTPSLLAAPHFMKQMEEAVHFHSDGHGISRYFVGDVRGCAVYSNGKLQADAFGPVTLENAAERTLITKFYNNLSGSVSEPLERRTLNSLATYRPATLYLRYAEAVNRLGFPTLAFATVKYGLSNAVISDTLRVDSNEVKRLPEYINFEKSVYNNNVGTASRGRGQGVSFDLKQFMIPEGVDSVLWVEEQLLQEMAAETCFEGNRFFDLLRIARHRDDYPSLLADKVAEKYDDKEAMRQHLMTEDNYWAK